VTDCSAWPSNAMSNNICCHSSTICRRKPVFEWRSYGFHTWPSLAFQSINQWPEQLETSQPATCRLHGQAIATSVNDSIWEIIFTCNEW